MTYGPEVVHEEVKDAENNDEQSGAVLGLESDNDHDRGNGTKERHADTPEGPLAAEDEANEEENEEHATGKLEVHLAILLVNLGKAGECLGLVDPRIGKHHEKAADDGEVAKEEVEIED